MAQKKKKNSGETDEQVLEHAYRKMTGHYEAPRKRSAGKIMAILAGLCLVLVLALGAAWFFGKDLDNPYIYNNITAAGIDLGGMTKEEAEDALLAATQNTYSREDMVIQILDTTYILSPGETGASLNVEELVKAAYNYGRQGSQEERQQALQTLSQRYTMDLLPYLNMDMSVIENAVSQLGKQFNSEFLQSSYQTEGVRPPLTAEYADSQGQTLLLTIGSPEYGLDTDGLYDKIIDAYNANTFKVTAECEYLEPEELDLDAIYQEFYMAPVSATMDPDTFEVSQDTYGYGFDLEQAKQALAQAEYGQTIQIPLFLITPEVTTASLSAILYRDELSAVSTWHTDNEDRTHNLILACAAVDGMVLYPGEVFSYNDALGERTEEKGYRPGASYVGSETVYTIGGGICQVSSNLYYSALLADLEIVDRECHMYPSDYIPFGMDATVNWGTLDFQFRNNTNYPIRIEASVSDGYVHVRLMGTDEKSYYVDMEYEIDEYYGYETVYEEYPPDNEEGYYDGQVITYPCTGYGVSTYRCKYDKETNELISREYEAYSYYEYRDEVICKIVYPTEPTETATPEIIPAETTASGTE